MELITAEASFVDAHTLQLSSVTGDGHRVVTSDKTVVATGTTATRDPNIAFDGRRIIASDDILNLEFIPKSMAVVGAGVVGSEYASMFAALGVRVTLIDMRERLLDFVDAEIVDTLAYHLRENRVTLRLGEEVTAIEPIETNLGEQVRIHLASGKKLTAEQALYSIGRTGATQKLGLESVGLEPDDRGRMVVNENYQTDVSSLYAVGDVIGFPSLASTSLDRRASRSAHHRGGGQRTDPHRPGGDGFWWKHRLFHQYGL